ncbi:MAG: serine hydrolase domain-containing protein [Acidimicrobiales bacterium]
MPLAVEVDPREVGLSAERLERLDALVRRYVDRGLLPGALAMVSRHSKVAHLFTYGSRDLRAGTPMETDTIVRLYSMTKPVTSVAAMMLYEEGAFDLYDPVSSVVPAFGDTMVWAGGNRDAPVLEPQRAPMAMWNLFSHTSGLTYGFALDHPVDALYRRAGYGLGAPGGKTLADACDDFAGFPLVFQPGSAWNYSVSTDVLGRVVEVLSGKSLDVFFQERIFGPLGMVDTGFFVPSEKVDRLAELYVPEAGSRRATLLPMPAGSASRLPSMLSGGGGLFGTAGDYHRFTQMLLGGGELEGTRLLGPRTVGLMTSNHLPGGATLTEFGRRSLPDLLQPGAGFGLGFAVVTDLAEAKIANGLGTYSWGGAASTTFFVDPAEKVTMVFLTQLLPSSIHPIRRELRQLVAQAIID